MKKRFFAVVLTVVMLVSLCGGIPFASAETDTAAVIAQTVVSDEVRVDVFRYTPAEFNYLGDNTPLIFMLGDKPYTEESANAALNTMGFREIADGKESCHIIFVSPSNGESWTSDDYTAMQKLAANATQDYTLGNDYSSGVSEEGRFYAGRFRQYIFAEGSAVAFAKQYLDTEDARYDMPDWNSWVDGFGSGYVYDEDGFDAATVAAGWEEIRHTYRVYGGDGNTFMYPYYYYDEVGIDMSIHTMPTAFEDIPEVEYYQYVPETIDLTSTTEKYPLILVFHGGANHPDAMTQVSQWPLIAKEQKLLVVAVNGPYGTTEHNADAIAQLIDDLAARYPIDTSRVYASGYSRGAAMSMNVATAHSDKIAGICLYELVSSFDTFDAPTLTVPAYIILGQDDFLKVFPRDTKDAVTNFNNLGKRNGFSYSYDEEIGGLWGRTFDLTESYAFPDQDVVFNVHSIQSKDDGIVYTKLVDAYNLAHNVHPCSTAMMWDYISQFSRNEDGTLNVQEHNPYTDVERSDWYYYSVLGATNANLFCGVGENRFAPEAKMTRAMFTSVLYRLAGRPEAAGKCSYTDVPANAWYEDAMIWATEHNVVFGVGNNRFAPNAFITREQVVSMLYRYAKSIGAAEPTDCTLEEFADYNDVSAYAREAMRWAVAEGIVCGIADGDTLTLAPKQTASRAQSAALFLRFYSGIATVGIS